jgi:predicted HTH transcriptional regulator
MVPASRKTRQPDNISMIENGEELFARLRNLEDQFVERKSLGDGRDWLKTIVAFANSTPIGYPALLFIGVRNDGTVEQHSTNWDTLQIKLMKEVAEAYPPIACQSFFKQTIVRYFA